MITAVSSAALAGSLDAAANQVGDEVALRGDRDLGMGVDHQPQQRRSGAAAPQMKGAGGRASPSALTRAAESASSRADRRSGRQCLTPARAAFASSIELAVAGDGVLPGPLLADLAGAGRELCAQLGVGDPLDRLGERVDVGIHRRDSRLGASPIWCEATSSPFRSCSMISFIGGSSLVICGMPKAIAS